jgi:hypothetical protein
VTSQLLETTLQVLSVGLASKLQERLEQLAAFRAALPLLGSPALDGAFKKGTKDLPGWWGAQQDEGLVAGVLQHGFGNWGHMFEVGGGAVVWLQVFAQAIWCIAYGVHSWRLFDVIGPASGRGPAAAPRTCQAGRLASRMRG